MKHAQWLEIMKNLFKTMHKLEQSSNIEPKFSQMMFPLMKFLKKTFNLKTGQFLLTDPSSHEEL